MLPSVRFFRAVRAAPVADLVESLLGDRDKSASLLELGAVWIDRVRARPDTWVPDGALVRVHTEPRRFDCPTDWRARVVERASDWIVLDKPAGVPCHPTLDNAAENLLVSASASLGEPLLLTHRLDVGTDGLVVVAPTRRGQRHVNALFARREVRKRYAARTTARVDVGVLRHFMPPSDRAPQRLRQTAIAGDLECVLEVAQCSELPDGYELIVEPFTGRTHQIRAQLSASGAPIVGDTLYGGAARADVECFDLTCISLDLAGHEIRLPRPVRWR